MLVSDTTRPWRIRHINEREVTVVSATGAVMADNVEEMAGRMIVQAVNSCEKLHIAIEGELVVGTEVVKDGFPGVITEIDGGNATVRLERGEVVVPRASFDGRFENNYVVN